MVTLMISFRFVRTLTALLTVLTLSVTAHGQTHRIREQISELKSALEGQRVGLLTNPIGVDDDFQLIADELVADEKIEMVCFFAPEHGLRGDHQAGGGDSDYTDSITGLPVYSLYGTRRAPTPDQLETIDVLVCDIQDVGARFYTFVWTMAYSLEAAGENGVSCVLFDRPNPIGLKLVEGPPIPFDGGLVGPVWPGHDLGVPTRHGMTAGEIARLVNNKWLVKPADLVVISVPGYTRLESFEETGYPWVLPSPNMPTRDTALVYPGTCIFEGVNMSEGRGTTRPFELIGAPWVNGAEYADAMNALQLPGVRFRAVWFQPSFDDYAGQRCGGIQVHVTDSATFESVRTGIELLRVACQLYPEDITLSNYVNTLSGIPDLRNLIKTQTWEQLEETWLDRRAEFLLLREDSLIYGETPLESWVVR